MRRFWSTLQLSTSISRKNYENSKHLKIREIVTFFLLFSCYPLRFHEKKIEKITKIKNLWQRVANFSVRCYKSNWNISGSQIAFPQDILKCLTRFVKASKSILTWKKNFFRRDGDPSRSGNWWRIRVSLVEESYQDAESSSLPINSSPLKYPGLALSKPYSNCSENPRIGCLI